MSGREPNARGNKPGTKRVSLERKEIRSAKGGNSVVKGVSRRIVVVPSPDPEIFEKAIFIVREDFVGEKGLTDKDILRQAFYENNIEVNRLFLKCVVSRKNQMVPSLSLLCG